MWPRPKYGFLPRTVVRGKLYAAMTVGGNGAMPAHAGIQGGWDGASSPRLIPDSCLRRKDGGWLLSLRACPALGTGVSGTPV